MIDSLQALLLPVEYQVIEAIWMDSSAEDSLDEAIFHDQIEHIDEHCMALTNACKPSQVQTWTTSTDAHKLVLMALKSMLLLAEVM